MEVNSWGWELSKGSFLRVTDAIQSVLKCRYNKIKENSTYHQDLQNLQARGAHEALQLFQSNQLPLPDKPFIVVFQ